jgi:putative inorganic carbon (HCO3(-)) transporter
MRDLLLVIIILGSVPFCFRNPCFGVMMWYWVSYFNPHRFTWSFAYNFPVALLVAVPTLAGTIFARKSLRALLVWESVCLAAVWLWFSFTYVNAKGIPLFAEHMENASYEMSHISKILLMTFVMILVVNSRDKLRGVMIVSAVSLGLLAVKGMLFGIRTGGEDRVWGPPDSFLADNNALALALNMAIPILFFLAREEKNRYVRWGLRVCFFCSIASVLLTYSRGGLLGLAVVLTAITFKSHQKALGAFLLAVAAVLTLSFAPETWMDRMAHFTHGELDSSAKQRLVAWETAWNFSHDYPIAGGSFDTLPDVNVFRLYQLSELPERDYRPATAAHSIYFQLLSDQGFVGLGLFLAMIASCLWSLWRIKRAVRKITSARWLMSYADMIQIAILGFMISGAFLGFVYLDVIYQMVATVVVLKVMFRVEVAGYLSQLGEKETLQVVPEEVAVPA